MERSSKLDDILLFGKQKISENILKTVPQIKSGILGLGSEAQKQMDGMAKAVIDGFTQIQLSVNQQLDALLSTFMGKIHKLKPKIIADNAEFMRFSL